MDNVVIGNLHIVYKDKWELYKRKRPRLYEELEYAVVKELDEKRILVDEDRLHKVLKVYNTSFL